MRTTIQSKLYVKASSNSSLQWPLFKHERCLPARTFKLIKCSNSWPFRSAHYDVLATCFLALLSVWLPIHFGIFNFVLICDVVVISFQGSCSTDTLHDLFSCRVSHLPCAPWNIHKYANDASLAMAEHNKYFVACWFLIFAASFLPVLSGQLVKEYSRALQAFSLLYATSWPR